jgi:hypothetical protein
MIHHREDIVRKLAAATIFVVTCATGLQAQGLREVPQRFMYVQPLGLVLGLGQVGAEFAVGRSTSIEVGGIGVYSREDGVEIFGGGPGIGVRKYLSGAELSGFVVGGRLDGVWLRGDNRDADSRFLGVGGLRSQESSMYLGVGLLMGFRMVSTSGFLIEPSISYEYLAGPRPLVPGSQDLQELLGLSGGIAFGWAW